MKALYTTILAFLCLSAAYAQTTYPLSTNNGTVTENFSSLPLKTSSSSTVGSWQRVTDAGNVFYRAASIGNNTESNGTFEIFLRVNTQEYKNVNVAWKESISGANNKTFTRVLDYRTSATGSFTNNTPVTVTATDLSTNTITVQLPAEATNSEFVEFRWRIVKSGTGQGVDRNYQLDDIIVAAISTAPSLTVSHENEIKDIVLNGATNALVFDAVPEDTKGYEQYTITGTNLTTNITVSLGDNAEGKFKIATDLSGSAILVENNYQTTPISIPFGSGSVTKTIFVIYVGNATTNSFGATLNHSSSGVSRNFSLEASTDEDLILLPVELSAFNGQTSNGAAKLAWTTASEINNDKFEVERSTDGLSFSKVGEVKGSGNSVVKRSYAFTDKAPAGGVNYYRLKQVDFDGTVSFSNVVALEVAGTVAATVYPTVATSAVKISIQNATGNATINVTDMTGKVIATYRNTTLREIEVPVQNSKSGMYLVRITDGQNQQVQRFIKQ